MLIEVPTPKSLVPGIVEPKTAKMEGMRPSLERAGRVLLYEHIAVVTATPLLRLYPYRGTQKGHPCLSYALAGIGESPLLYCLNTDACVLKLYGDSYVLR